MHVEEFGDLPLHNMASSSERFDQSCFFDRVNETFCCHRNPAKVLKYSVLLLFVNHFRAHFSEVWEDPWTGAPALPNRSNGKIARTRAPLFTPTQVSFYQKCSMLHEGLGISVDECCPDAVSREVFKILQAVESEATKEDADWRLNHETTQVLARHLRSRMTETSATVFAELDSCTNLDGADGGRHLLFSATKIHGVETGVRSNLGSGVSVRQNRPVDPLGLAFDAWSLEWCDPFVSPVGETNRPWTPPGFAVYANPEEAVPNRRYRLIPTGGEVLQSYPPGWIVSTGRRRSGSTSEDEEDTEGAHRRASASTEHFERRRVALLVRGYSDGVAKKLARWAMLPENVLLSFGFLMELLRCCD